LLFSCARPPSGRKLQGGTTVQQRRGKRIRKVLKGAALSSLRGRVSHERGLPPAPISVGEGKEERKKPEKLSPRGRKAGFPHYLPVKEKVDLIPEKAKEHTFMSKRRKRSKKGKRFRLEKKKN